MKDVLITVRGSQDYSDWDDGSELTTIGKYGIRDGKMLLTYNEGNMIGTDGVKTMLQIDGNRRVVLKRTGSIKNNIIIEQGRHNDCFYSTPEGHFVLGIYGDGIVNSLGEHGGKLSMRYSIDINSGLLSRNSIEIQVKEVENNVSN